MTDTDNPLALKLTHFGSLTGIPRENPQLSVEQFHLLISHKDCRSLVQYLAKFLRTSMSTGFWTINLKSDSQVVALIKDIYADRKMPSLLIDELNDVWVKIQRRKWMS